MTPRRMTPRALDLTTLYKFNGVSLCMHAYYLAFGLVPDFTREAFPVFRRRMVRNLLGPGPWYCNNFVLANLGPIDP